MCVHRNVLLRRLRNYLLVTSPRHGTDHQPTIAPEAASFRNCNLSLSAPLAHLPRTPFPADQSPSSKLFPLIHLIRYFALQSPPLISLLNFQLDKGWNFSIRCGCKKNSTHWEKEDRIYPDYFRRNYFPPIRSFISLINFYARIMRSMGIQVLLLVRKMKSKIWFIMLIE